MKSLSEFQKGKEFLICIDSDGCAMDTMNIKHIQCFGPCMVKEWALEEWKEPVLNRWNEINLYSMTRGTNRFLALAMVLQEVDKRWCKIEGVEALAEWTKSSDELSNDSLKKIVQKGGDLIFGKALSWSKAVNRAIDELCDEVKRPFEGAREGLAAAHERADVAIVSSANMEAVIEEWQKNKLIEHVDVCLTQNEGSKAFCIGKMLEKGYSKAQVLMVGDALGDRMAAEKNGVLYYPVLVKQEARSWKKFIVEALPRFLNRTYEGCYQEERNEEFEKNLS